VGSGLFALATGVETAFHLICSVLMSLAIATIAVAAAALAISLLSCGASKDLFRLRLHVFMSSSSSLLPPSLLLLFPPPV